MNKFQHLLRIGLGVLLLVFGFNKFFWFLQDFDFTGYPQAEYLFNALRYSWSESVGKGYIMAMVGFFEIIIGAMLVLKKWVPLALVMLVPISINLVLFHAFLNLPYIGPALLVAIINTYLMLVTKKHYISLFQAIN